MMKGKGAKEEREREGEGGIMILTSHRFLARGTEGPSRGMVVYLTVWLSLVVKVVPSGEGHLTHLLTRRGRESNCHDQNVDTVSIATGVCSTIMYHFLTATTTHTKTHTPTTLRSASPYNRSTLGATGS